MDTATLRAARLRSHRLTAPMRSVTDAATTLCATQSQDFWGGRLALAARTRGHPPLSRVDAAIDRGELVRASSLRGTLHIVAARDLAWILSVVGERVMRQSRGRYRQLGLDDETLAHGERQLTAALAGGGALTRAEAMTILADAGIDPSGQRGIHVLFAMGMRGIVCWGPVVPREGAATREQRLVLTEDWIAESARPADPVTELFVRYVQGHGPATVADFAWWAGLPITQAREAAESAADRVRRLEQEGGPSFVARRTPRTSVAASDVLALPSFEEYLISYADRTPVARDASSLRATGPGKNGMVHPVIVAAGEIVGTWRPPPPTATGAAPRVSLFDGAVVDPVALDAALARASATLAG